MTLKQICIGAVLMVAALFSFYMAAKINDDWAAFAKSHDCKPVPTTTYSPGKVGWSCNDGVTYWR
ncbi:hypothetical protein HZF02_18060 [Pseudomonas yamanorum]|nr:hypothetical protein HZF02_18060 [Pseudomonas yamanorum]